MPGVLVTIPAYNEAETVAGVIKRVKYYMNGTVNTILVVSDGSMDQTEAAAWSAGAVVRCKQHSGLADTFRTEMAIALAGNFDVIVHIDADGQYDPADIPSLLKWIDRGYDLVLGNRLHQRVRGHRWYRYALNKGGAFAYSVVLGQWIPDMTTGFRVFTREVAALPIVSRYTYTQEQLWRAIKAGYKVKSVPVSFRRRDGKSRLISGTAQYLMRSAMDLWRFAR